MSLLSDNVIPGNQGRVFGTNARKERDLERIREKVLELDGVREVTLDFEAFPKQITVYTNKLVRVEKIEEKVISSGFHAIPKDKLEI